MCPSCILGEWHTTAQLGKRQNQHHFNYSSLHLIQHSLLYVCVKLLCSWLYPHWLALAAVAAYVAGDLPYSTRCGIRSVWVTWETMQLLSRSEKL